MRTHPPPPRCRARPASPCCMLGRAGLEAVLEPFEPTFHMGKLATMSPQGWRERYGENLDRFVALARHHDPTGKFTNDYTDKVHQLYHAYGLASGG